VTLQSETERIPLHVFDDAMSSTVCPNNCQKCNGVSSGANANYYVVFGYEILHYGAKKLSSIVQR
jgi:hypothetical protein